MTFPHIKEIFPIRLSKCFSMIPQKGNTFRFYVYVYDPSQIFIFVVR